MDENQICSVCKKPGVNFLRGNDVQKLKDCLSFNNILIDGNPTQICDLCVDEMNRIYCQYLNLDSNIFMKTQEEPDSDGKLDESTHESAFLEYDKNLNKSTDSEKLKISKNENFSKEPENYDVDSSSESEISGNSDPESSDLEEFDDDITYKCEICGNSFADLDTHYVQEHSSQSGKSKKSNSRKRKRKIHSPIKNSSPRVAIVKPMKRKIEKVSPGKKKRKCPKCKKSFHKFELNRHMDESHPGTYLFACDNCSFKSNYGQTMAAHKRRDQCIEYTLEEMFGSD